MIKKTVFFRKKTRFFYHFHKYHMKILLGYFTANVWRENIFKSE